MDNSHGGKRDSIADTQDKIDEIFRVHPETTWNPDEEMCLPLSAVPGVLIELDMYDANTRNSIEGFMGKVDNNSLVPSYSILDLVHKLGKTRDDSPEATPEAAELGSSGSEEALDEHSDDYDGSRPPSREVPQTPKSSIFDTGRRQRTTPLGAAPPSSFAPRRPRGPGRRRSDAGQSDSESGHGRSSSRTSFRAASNPGSPTMAEPPASIHASLGTPSPYRPGSRSSSRIGRTAASPFDDYDSDEGAGATATYNDLGRRNDDFLKSVNSLPMPRSGDSDEEEEEDEEYLVRVVGREIVSSTTSIELGERLEALVKANQALVEKLRSVERNINVKQDGHDTELEQYRMRIEELEGALNAAKRDDRDLRNKERQQLNQISDLEAEVASLTAQYQAAHNTVAMWQKNAQEATAKSASYRDELRQRDFEMSTVKSKADQAEYEHHRLRQDIQAQEARSAQLEADIKQANMYYAQLEEQKQESLILKETIDRLRMELEEARNNPLDTPLQGPPSRGSTITRSLGAELGNLFIGPDEDLSEESQEEEESTTAVDSDGEDVIQTVITRRRKVGRTHKHDTLTQEFKEYADTYVQHEPEEFSSVMSTQTDPEPVVRRLSFSIQTEPIPDPEPVIITRSPTPPPLRQTAEMEIQTDPMEVEVVPPPSPVAGPSTIVQIVTDQPPAYSRDPSDMAREHQTGNETLKKWHDGRHFQLPVRGIPGGVSIATAEDWEALKAELGVECHVIDRAISESGERKDETGKGNRRRRSSRLYNIYNTYVYGDGNVSGAVAHTAIVMGASALVFLALSPYIGGAPIVPGGASAYDRAAWNSFNSIQPPGDGFAVDGTRTVWSFLGRVGGGAARVARGYPT